MKPFHLATFLFTSGLLVATATQAQLIPFLSRPHVTPQKHNSKDTGTLPAYNPAQQVANQNPIMASDSSPEVKTNSNVNLADILGTHRMISIFAGLTRDINSLQSRLETSSQNSTLLAPSNTALKALPRKPWEDPEEYSAFGSNAYDGQDGSERAEANLRRFVEAHVVGVSPWSAGEKVKTLGGREVWWEEVEGSEGMKRVVQPWSIEVEKVASRVGNGEVWVLSGVMDYARGE